MMGEALGQGYIGKTLGGPWRTLGGLWSSFLSSLGGLWEDFGSSLGGLWEDFWSFILYIIKSQKSNSVKLQRVLMMGDALGQGYVMMLTLGGLCGRLWG